MQGPWIRQTCLLLVSMSAAAVSDSSTRQHQLLLNKPRWRVTGGGSQNKATYGNYQLQKISRFTSWTTCTHKGAIEVAAPDL